MSDEMVIRCCAPTLAAIKTGSLFNCAFESRREMTESLRAINRCLLQKGVTALPLRYQSGKALVYSIHITEEERRICDFCYEAAQVLDCADPLSLRPVMRYAPEDDDWAKLDDDEVDFPQPSDLMPYEHLLNSLLALQDTLIQVVHSNSAFILSDMDFDVGENEDEDKRFDPAGFVPLLQELSTEDYDPIFGKAPDQLILVFSEAIARLSAYVNDLPGYLDWKSLCPEKEDQVLKRRLDDYKMSCIQHFLSDWQNALEQELDRAYQGQRIDMMQASSQIARMTEEL